ncbi:MAG: selenocysteine-specific translation elongation factor [Candidatus Xenobiia bacterium LiM19]
MKESEELKKRSEIVQVIVGTAGHVDHGKTSLVKVLTGCDTDRLPEEKLRKLSIDLGFAPCRLPGNRVVGIVDVPGHIDFIKNMVAGAASIDVLLLVVAADDGIMPQTSEHLEIVSLLRTPQLMVVLTKVDLVDETMKKTVILEIEEFLKKKGYPDAPIVPYSSVTGEGFSDVRRRMNELVARVRPVSDTRAFRMHIERVFSIKGYGTVATGIPISGSAAVGERLEILPMKRECVVRAIEAYKHDIETAPPSSCAAINLRDIEAESLSRGMTLAAPKCYRSTKSVIVSLRNVSDDIALPELFETWFLCGTGKARATARLLFTKSLKAGEESFAYIRLPEPFTLASGDRYIIRALNPSVTVGGGEVLSTGEYNKKKAPAGYSDLLVRAHLALMEGRYLQTEVTAGLSLIFTGEELKALSHSCDIEAEKQIASLVQEGELIDMGSAVYVLKDKIPALMNVVIKALDSYHRNHRGSWGIEHHHLCTILGIEARSYPALQRLIISDGRVILSRGRYALPDFKPLLKSVDINLKDRILAFIEEGGVLGQPRGDILTKFAIKDDKYQIIARLLLEEGDVKAVGNHLLCSSHYEKLRSMLLDLFREKEIVTISDLRPLVNIGRFFVIKAFEAFDSEKMTRRVNEGRILTSRWRKALDANEIPLSGGKASIEPAP